MELNLRPGTSDDAAVCGDICYRAFKSIADQHNYPPDFPSAEVAVQVMTGLLGQPGFYTVIAEADGQTHGFIAGDERDTITGLGPMAIDPDAQNKTVGRQLLQHALDRAEAKGAPGVRFLQAAWHNRSLALYTKLGCDARELMTNLQGPPIAASFPGYDVRPATTSDLPACDQLCLHVHGHTRHGELSDAIEAGTATVVERGGRITGYATGIAFFSHAVAETNDDLKALIAAAPEFGGPGFILPARNAELFRWCLTKGLRVVQQMTLMTRGLYNEPRGAYLPSILY